MEKTRTKKKIQTEIKEEEIESENPDEDFQIPELKLSIKDYSKITQLQQIVKSLKTLLADTSLTMKFTPTEILVRSMNKERYAMIDLKIQNSYFDKFQINQDMLVTITASRLNKVFQTIRKSVETLIFDFDNREQVLIITLFHDTGFTREYTIPTILADEYATDLDTLPTASDTSKDFKTIIELYSNQLTTILKDLSLISSSILITATPKELILSNSIDVKTKNKAIIPTHLFKDYNSPAKEEVISLYPQDLLDNISLLDSYFESNTLKFYTDKPLFLGFDTTDLSVHYLIAPEKPPEQAPEEEEQWEDIEIPEKEEE